jgi:hypothetical protein
LQLFSPSIVANPARDSYVEAELKVVFHGTPAVGKTVDDAAD